MGEKKKTVFFSEWAYVAGLIFLAIGVVFSEKSNFGVSMIVAPAYVIYRFVNPFWSAFTFGMAEYCLQAVLLIIMCLVIKSFKISYLLSFVTAFVYGWILDAFMLLGQFLPDAYIWQRGIYYLLGMLFAAMGVSMMFRTYISAEVYELLVKEISQKFSINIHKFKTGYDFFSFLLAVLLSFVFFGLGNFVGVGWGTVVCAAVNGFIISRFSKLYDRIFEFQDALKWRTFFENMPS